MIVDLLYTVYLSIKRNIWGIVIHVAFNMLGVRFIDFLHDIPEFILIARIHSIDDIVEMVLAGVICRDRASPFASTATDPLTSRRA